MPNTTRPAESSTNSSPAGRNWKARSVEFGLRETTAPGAQAVDECRPGFPATAAWWRRLQRATRAALRAKATTGASGFSAYAGSRSKRSTRRLQFAIVIHQRRQQVRRSRMDSHLGDFDQRRRQRKRPSGIAVNCLIVRSPLGKLGPAVLQTREPGHERQNVRRQQEQKFLQVVARYAMSRLVTECSFFLFVA